MRPRATEAGEDLVEDQKQAIFVCERTQPPQDLGLVKQHPARALHQRLHDDCGDLIAVARNERVKRRRALIVMRQIGDDVLMQNTGEMLVHAFVGIAHRHRGECVAVIGAAEGQYFGPAANAAIEPILHSHLHRDLDRDRAAVREEHAIKIAGQQGRKPCRQPHRRLVHQAAEHHMRHHLKLACHRGANMRMVIAVAGGPPARNSIHEFAAVREPDARSLGRYDGQRRRDMFHLCVWQPDVFAPILLPTRPVRHHAALLPEPRVTVKPQWR